MLSTTKLLALCKNFKRGTDLVISVGKRIRSEREALGLNQGEAAERLQIAQSYMNRLEKGNVAPTAEILEAVCSWRGRSLHWLLFGDEAEDARLAAARRLAAEMRKATGDTLTLSMEQAQHAADLLEEAGEPRVWAGVAEAAAVYQASFGLSVPAVSGEAVELPPGVHIYNVEGDELAPLASAGQRVLCVRAAAGEGGPGVVTIARHRWRIVGVLF